MSARTALERSPHRHRPGAAPGTGLGGPRPGDPGAPRGSGIRPGQAAFQAASPAEADHSERRRMPWRRPRTRSSDPDAAMQAVWTRGHQLLAVAIQLVLVAALVCGPAALAWTWWVARSSGVGAVSAPAAGYDDWLMSRRSTAGEVAASWVSAWLTTPQQDADALQRWYGGQVVLPRQAAAVADVRVVDAVPAAPGVWAVTVAATVTPQGGATARRYFQVPVAVSGDAGAAGASVMSAPVPVSAPAGASVPPLTYPVRVSGGSAVAGTVTQFVTASLSGQDVTRFVRPGSAVAPAVDAASAWASVRVREISATDAVPEPTEGARTRVLASVEVAGTAAAGAQGQWLGTVMPLTLVARDGRWEIDAVDPVPAIPEPAPAGTDSQQHEGN